MTETSRTIYLTVHGHFYQPPRENPWTERIDLQPDAAPFHNWNDRILIQCYQPNAMSRIVDDEGKVIEMVNNFRLLSFDVGPTLLGWLARCAPIVYHRILEGDRRSIPERGGHGNALAQVYNHMILPLAEERDQRTQIRWGVFEFKKRFARDPEGIWLPETAASERTLEILIEEGVRFTILAPEQAQKIRRIGGNFPWEDVSSGSIDSTRPYRFFHSQGPSRWIDLFFFDGPLSRDVSFGDLLFDSKKFIHRIRAAHRPERAHPELIHTASDGEAFGHHKAFGERVITFLLQHEAERHGIKRVNYGEHLEKFPPQFEVKIKPGEGTSWSCRHGVGRWKEDCGCHTGGLQGWNQKWRAPLREAVRFLARGLARIYEENSRLLLRDPWAARDESIELILDRSEKARESFLEKHAARSLSTPEKIQAIQLLEMERFALLTETSCGWFFNDLSGIETVQILRYALRAMELAAPFGGAEMENEFVKILAQAKSNRPEFGDGREIWEKRVKAAHVPPERIIAHYVFRKLFEMEVSPSDFYNQQIEAGETERESLEEMNLLMGVVRAASRNIPEPQDFVYAIFQDGISRLECYVRHLPDRDEFHKMNVTPLGLLRKKDAKGLTAHLRQIFGAEPFLLRDLFPEEREEILRLLSRQMRKDLYQTNERFYKGHQPEITLFRDAASGLPEEFRGVMEWTMGERLMDTVRELEGRTSFEEIARKGKAILEEARSWGLSVRTQPAVEFLSRLLNAWIEKLFHEPDTALVQKIEKVLELARELQIQLHDRIAQDLFFVFAQKTLREWIGAHHQEGGDPSRLKAIQAVILLGSQLGFNMKQYENQLKPGVEIR